MHLRIIFLSNLFSVFWHCLFDSGAEEERELPAHLKRSLFWIYYTLQSSRKIEMPWFVLFHYLLSSPKQCYLGIVMHFQHFLTEHLKISDWSYLLWLCWTSWQNPPTSSEVSPTMLQLMAQCFGKSGCGCLLPLLCPGLSPWLTTAPRGSQTTSGDSIPSEKLQRRGNRLLFS